MSNQDHSAWLFFPERERRDLIEHVKARKILGLTVDSTTLRFDSEHLLKCWNSRSLWTIDQSTSQRLACIEGALRFANELRAIEFEAYLDSLLVDE